MRANRFRPTMDLLMPRLALSGGQVMVSAVLVSTNDNEDPFPLPTVYADGPSNGPTMSDLDPPLTVNYCQ